MRAINRTIKGIDFGPVWGQSGIQGFFGEGWWFHRLLRILYWITLGLFEFTFRGVTFVAKTVTLDPRPGNMKTTWFPDCVVVKFWKGVALNAVGLTNDGVHTYIMAFRWQDRTEPFFISFMSVASTMDERVEEFRKFIEMMKCVLPRFRARFGIQLNMSCPNTEHHAEDLLVESRLMLDIASTIMSEVPVVVKLSVVDTTPELALQIAAHPACGGICVSNTFAWKKIPEALRRALFGSTESPLPKQYGGGGLSGAPLLPLVVQWVTTLRRLGYIGYVNAGGGVLHPMDVFELYRAGADSISVGVVAMLRPWRLGGITARAYELFR